MQSSKQSHFFRFIANDLYASFPSLVHVICPARLIRLGLITQVVFFQTHKSCNFSLCKFYHPSVTSPLLGPDNFLTKTFLDTL